MLDLIMDLNEVIMYVGFNLCFIFFVHEL